MASYDLLKTLTIDGTTMGLDENLGTEVWQSKNTAITGVYVEAQGATVTITEPGLYYLNGSWKYASGTSTGIRNTGCYLRIKRNGSSTWATARDTGVCVGQGTQWSMLEASTTLLVLPTEVPATVAVFGCSNMTSAANYTSIQARKLIYLGGGS